MIHYASKPMASQPLAAMPCTVLTKGGTQCQKRRTFVANQRGAHAMPCFGGKKMLLLSQTDALVEVSLQSALSLRAFILFK